MEIRDKLFTEEQYLKQLKMYDEDISYYEQMHLSGKHIGYDSLFNYRLRYLLVQYSMGQDIDNLKIIMWKPSKRCRDFGRITDFILKCCGFCQ